MVAIDAFAFARRAVHVCVGGGGHVDVASLFHAHVATAAITVVPSLAAYPAAEDQFTVPYLVRELNKAFAGFRLAWPPRTAAAGCPDVIEAWHGGGGAPAWVCDALGDGAAIATGCAAAARARGAATSARALCTAAIGGAARSTATWS